MRKFAPAPELSSFNSLPFGLSSQPTVSVPPLVYTCSASATGTSPARPPRAVELPVHQDEAFGDQLHMRNGGFDCARRYLDSRRPQLGAQRGGCGAPSTPGSASPHELAGRPAASAASATAPAPTAPQHRRQLRRGTAGSSARAAAASDSPTERAPGAAPRSAATTRAIPRWSGRSAPAVENSAGRYATPRPTPARPASRPSRPPARRSRKRSSCFGLIEWTAMLCSIRLSTTGPGGVSIATPTSPAVPAANDRSQFAISDKPAPPCSNIRSPSTFPPASVTHT